MTNIRNSILAFLLAFLPLVAHGQVMPLTGQRFALPLEDGTTTQAVILNAPQNCLHLVYATRSGQLVFLHVSQQHPEPGPVPPPPPPPAKTLHVAIVHDPAKSTAPQRQVMADRSWREAIIAPHSFDGIIPFGLIDPNTKKPPAGLVPFLQAAKDQTLPCLIFLNENKEPILQINLPNSAQAILDLFRKHGGQTNDHTSYRLRELHRRNIRDEGKNTPPKGVSESRLFATSI